MKTILYFILLFLWLVSVRSYAIELEILTEQYAPLNYREANDTKVRGFTTEIVEAILKATGNEHLTIKMYPWARAYKLIQEKPNVMLFSMARNDRREKKFKWVGPIAERTQWMWKLKSRTDIQIKTLEDAKKYSISVVPQSAVHEYLVDQGFTIKQFEFIHDGSLSVKKLLQGRDDLHFDLKSALAYRLNLLGMSTDLVEAILPLPQMGDYYLAFSLGTPDSTVILFQKALDVLKANGTFSIIEEKYKL